MDLDEESCEEVGRSCKRQKRNSTASNVADPLTMDENEQNELDKSEAPADIMENKQVKIPFSEDGNSSSCSNNNNKDEISNMPNLVDKLESQDTLPAGAGVNDTCGVNVVKIPSMENLGNVADDAVNDDEDEPVGEDGIGSISFNHRSIPPTRSYSRINIDPPLSPSSSEIDDGEHTPVVGSDAEDENDADNAISVSSQEMESNPSSEDSFEPPDNLSFYYTESDSNEDNDVDDEHMNDSEQEQVDAVFNEVSSKAPPPYSWNLTQHLMDREHNINNRIDWRQGHTTDYSFGQSFYAARQAIERLALSNTLKRHSGCVNSLNFNRSGDLICSGSDDLRIIVWDWAKQKIQHNFKSGHLMNIFQTKFIDSAGCLDIVSSSRDGHVRRAVIPPSGGNIKPTRLYTHRDAVHKLVVVPSSRHEIISAGEDGAVKHFDLRTDTGAITLVGKRSTEDRIRLFSIAHHPYAPQFCISGCDHKVRVYDKRKIDKPIHVMYPKTLTKNTSTQITCAVYNHSGSEILASYRDGRIYLYNARDYKEGEHEHSYGGHINSRTIKGVNFFGPHSEYVISGSDCGHVFFWDKNTESIINFLKADSGVGNCLEPHPWMPILATSGLGHNVKIWTPSSDTLLPDSSKLKEILRRNIRRNVMVNDDTDSLDNISRNRSPRAYDHNVILRRLHSGSLTASQPDEADTFESNSSHSTDSDGADTPASNSSHSSHQSATTDDASGNRRPGRGNSSDEDDFSLGCRTQ